MNEQWWAKLERNGVRWWVPFYAPEGQCRKSVVSLVTPAVGAWWGEETRVLKVKKAWVWRPWKYGALSGY